MEYSVKNGIDIIRIFDALNDVRNLEVAIDETVKQGAHASGTICFTTSPVHTLEKNVAMVKDLQKMGVKSIAIKDMAGIMGPRTPMTWSPPSRTRSPNCRWWSTPTAPPAWRS